VSICDTDVGRAEFDRLKATLTLEKSFVDERVPPVGPGSRGGFNAIWRATDAAGKRYTVQQSVLDGRERWCIRPE